MEFTIGNTVSIVKNPQKNKSGIYNDHQWTAFVRLAQKHKNLVKLGKILDKVHIELCEGFKDRHHHLIVGTKQEVSLTYKGWGTFEMPITLHFKKELGIPPKTFDHELCFDGRGEWRDFKVRIER